MFGYVRPIKDRLTDEELEKFRAAYCGLCHCMRRRCGVLSSFLINYDFTFMAMLLCETRQSETCLMRCIAHPFKKRLCRCSSESFDAAADMSIILGWLKLRDNIRDDGFFKSILSGAASVLLRRAYKKACAARPDFALTAERLLSELTELERGGCTSLDETADKFAKIISAASDAADSAANRRVLSYLFYHIGRLIYILDAVDDLEDDLACGAYNAAALRYELKSAVLTDDAAENLDITIRHSINLIASDFQLLSETEYSGILTNIIYLGIPAVASEVLRKRMPPEPGTNTGDKE